MADIREIWPLLFYILSHTSKIPPCMAAMNLAFGLHDLQMPPLTKSSVLITSLILSVFAVRSTYAAEPPIPAQVEFNRDVRPILSDNCFHCHGPDKNARQAELRLDIRDEAIKAAASGANADRAGQVGRK